MSNQPLHHTNIRPFDPLDNYSSHGGFEHHYESRNDSIFTNQWKVGVADANARAAASVANSKAHSDIWTSFWGNFGSNCTGLGNGLVGVANFSLAMKKIFGDDDKPAVQANQGAQVNQGDAQSTGGGIQSCGNKAQADADKLKNSIKNGNNDQVRKAYDDAKKTREDVNRAIKSNEGQVAANNSQIDDITNVKLPAAGQTLKDDQAKIGQISEKLAQDTKAQESIITTNEGIKPATPESKKAIADAKAEIKRLKLQAEEDTKKVEIKIAQDKTVIEGLESRKDGLVKNNEKITKGNEALVEQQKELDAQIATAEAVIGNDGNSAGSPKQS